ncbi:hypothetical protein MAR_022099 [Mya arenaria]|uniref:Uncharacterized protein n=1 Tax=Mya arenaria TaxID=6604 RepID=A0ABY7DJ54_MYAAR|nr:hypothetical protein MAR_022099 [Mya arenaria]
MQSENKIWKAKRILRLTSFNFEAKGNNNSTCLVKNLFYSNFKGNIFTIRCLNQVDSAIKEYSTKNENCRIEKCG